MAAAGPGALQPHERGIVAFAQINDACIIFFLQHGQDAIKRLAISTFSRGQHQPTLYRYRNPDHQYNRDGIHEGTAFLEKTNQGIHNFINLEKRK